MKEFTGEKKPRIDYPCRWVFKLFGTDECLLREAVAGIMPGADHDLTLSRTSRNNRYVCMNLALTVASGEDRDAVYEALSGHSRILFVL